jgi:hypothetical protein
MSSPISYDLQGQGGGIAIDAAYPVAGNFRWIQIINDAQISTLASDNILNDAALIGPTIPAGVGIGGRFTEIELTSGLAIAYYA